MTDVVLGIAVPVILALVAVSIVGGRAIAGEPTFRCAAYRTGTWEQYRRTVVATDATEAVSILEGQGLMVSHVRRVWPVRRALERGVRLTDFRAAIPHRQIAEMADSIATLLENNMTIQDSLVMYGGQKPDNKCREVLRSVESDIAGGSVSVEEAFATRAASFGSEIATMIRVGGTTEVGAEGTFRQIAEMAGRRAQFGSQIKRALIEPAMIGVTVLALLVYMTVFVLPQFKSFYQGYGSSLPWITTFTLDVTDWGLTHLWLLSALGLAVACGLWQCRRHRATRLRWDRAVLGLPLYGKIAEAAALGQRHGHGVVHDSRGGATAGCAARIDRHRQERLRRTGLARRKRRARRRQLPRSGAPPRRQAAGEAGGIRRHRGRGRRARRDIAPLCHHHRP